MKRMIWSRFFRRWFLSRRAAPMRTASKRLPRPSVLLRLEALEDRTLLSNTYIVNQLGDSGTGIGLTGDIRYCITQANLYPGSTITFDTNALFGSTGSGTISLSTGELPIKVNMAIKGPAAGPSFLTISGLAANGGASRIFDITSSMANVSISNLTVANGNAEVANLTVPGNQGGDIFNGGTLTLSSDIVTNGLSTGTVGGPIGRGGAIYNAEGTTGTGATLILDDTLVENSSAVGYTNPTIPSNGGTGEGGGIFNDINATLIVQNGSQIVNNQALGGRGDNATALGKNGFSGGVGAGGGIYNNKGSLQIDGSSTASIILADNLAQGGLGGDGVVGAGGVSGKVGGAGSAGGSGGAGGTAEGGGVFSTGAFTLQYAKFVGNQAVAGSGGNGSNGGTGGSGTTGAGGAGGAGGGGGVGGTAQGGGIYNGVGALAASNVVFGLDSNGRGNQALGGIGGGAGAGGAGGKGKTDGGSGGAGGVGSAGGFAKGGALVNYGSDTLLTNTTFTASVAGGGQAGNAGPAGNGGGATGNGGAGGAAGAGSTGGRGGDAVGGAVFNAVGNLSISNGSFAGSQAIAGAGGNGSGGGLGGNAGGGSSKIAGGTGGKGGNGGRGGDGGNAQGGGFYNLVGTVTINGTSFTAKGAPTGNQAISGAGGAGGNGGSGGQGGDNGATTGVTQKGGAGGNAGAGGAGGNGGLAEGGAGGNQGGDTTITGAVFSASLAETGNAGTGGGGGTGGAGGNGGFFASNGLGGNGGNGGNGGTSGPDFGGAFADTASNLTVSNSSFGGGGGGNQVLGGAGGGGGVGGTIGTFGHPGQSGVHSPPSSPPAPLSGNGGQGGDGASVYGAALSASGSTKTIQISNSTFSLNAIAGGAGGAGNIGGLFGDGGLYAGISGQGGEGGLAQGGAVSLSTTTLQSATLTKDTITTSNASGGGGGVGTVRNNTAGSGGGNGGSVYGAGLADVNYSLDMISSSITSNTGAAGDGASGGSASATQPYTFGGGSGGAGGKALGGGVFLSNNGSNTLSLSVSGGSASGNSLIGGNGGLGGNAGASGQSKVVGGAGGAGGLVQGGGLYILAGSSGVNTTTIANFDSAGNVLSGGAGAAGGAGYNASGGNAGSAQGGAVFNSSLNTTSGQSSSLSISYSTLSGNQATGGTGGNAGSATTPNGGDGGDGGSGGNADGAGLYNGDNTPLMVVNTTLGGSSTSTTSSINYNILSGGRGGAGGDAGTPGGVGHHNGGPGGDGGSVLGGNVYNSSDADFINDTIVFGQAVSYGLGGPGGSGAGSGGLLGAAGTDGASLAGGYYAAAGTNSVGNTIIDLNAASTLSTDVYGAFTSLGNNILGSTAGATGFSAANDDQIGITIAQLNLGPLQNNGGPTPTDALLNTVNFVSIAIDAGNNNLVTSTSYKWFNLFGANPTDQRGYSFLRIYNGTVDVGAYEYQPVHAMPVINSLSPNSAVEQGDSFTLTINGNNFIPGATVIWAFSGRLASYSSLTLTPSLITSNQITVTVPTNGLPDEGPVNVTVDVPDGSGVTGEVLISLPVTFTITEGTSVTLTGPGNQTDNEGTILSAQNGNLVQITSSDPDTTFNDLVNGKDTLPPGLSIDPNTGVISGTIGLYAAGTYPVTINGIDDGTIQGTYTFTWTVNDTTPPTLTNPGSQNNNEGATITPVTISGEDAAPGTFTDVVNGQHTLPPGLSIDPSTGVISGTIGLYAAGTYTVTISAADVAGNVGSTQFTWTVNDTTPPTLTNPGNQSGDEGQQISLQIQAVDADNFAATDLPPGLSINASTGLISGTISQPGDGTYNVTVTGYDTDNTTSNNGASVQFIWTVADNLPPILTNPGNQSSNEGAKVSLQIQALDADSFSATGLPTGLSIDPNSGLISGTIDPRGAGNYSVNVTATDNGYSSNITFNWIVADTTPPGFTNPGPQTNNEGDALPASGLATYPVDADPGSITDVVNGQHTLPTGLTIDPNTGVITGTIGKYAAGTYTVTISATDGTGNTGSIQFTWTVNDTTPPGFSIGNQANNEGYTIPSPGLATNPVDADPGSITDVVNGQHTLPTGLTINSTTGVITGTIGKYAAGTYTVTISATDGTGNTGSTQFTWTVNDTTAPTLSNPGNQSNNEGDPVNLQIRAQDAETFSATGLPTGLSIDANTGLISGTIDPYAAGTYNVTVTVTDTDNTTSSNSASVQFTWTVAAITPPGFTNPGTQNNNEGDSVSLALKPEGADPGSITATGLPPGLSIDATTGVISGTIGAYDADHSPYTVTISATRNGTIKGNLTFTWNVFAGTPPALANPGPQSSNETAIVNLAVHTVDAQSFSATGLPPGLSINGTTGVISGTVLAPAGTYEVTVRAVRDGHIASATFPWVVNQMPTSAAITNITNVYIGLYQVETVTAQVSDPEGIPISGGFVTFLVNGESFMAPVNNGFATVTFATPMLSFDTTILMNDFNSHALDAVYGDPAGIFGSGSISVSEPAMLLDFLIYLQSLQFSSLAQQLAQLQS
jgi:hypothetical protein